MSQVYEIEHYSVEYHLYMQLGVEDDILDWRAFYVLNELLAGGDEEYHYLGLVDGEVVLEALSSNPEYNDGEFNVIVALQISNIT